MPANKPLKRYLVVPYDDVPTSDIPMEARIWRNIIQLNNTMIDIATTLEEISAKLDKRDA